MNKRKRAHIVLINKLSFGPIILLPFVYWCFVKIQKFNDWYLIPIIAIPLGLIVNQIVLSILRKNTPEILSVKNEKNFKLSHYTGAISILLMLLITTILNVYITVESKLIEYNISGTGERGAGKNKTSYVEIIHENGELEKIDFGKPFIEGLKNKERVKLTKHTSVFGLVYHDEY